MGSGRMRLAWHIDGLKEYYRRYYPAYLQKYFR